MYNEQGNAQSRHFIPANPTFQLYSKDPFFSHVLFAVNWEKNLRTHLLGFENTLNLEQISKIQDNSWARFSF